jgi:thiosulfate/3-mercaptopyruvate sulfurtransferase
MPMNRPTSLVTTEQLAAMIGHPDLCLYDCTANLQPAKQGSDVPYLVASGRKTFEDGHIPGADFLDLQEEFSDSATHLRFMMPSISQLEEAFGRHGLDATKRIVLYSIGTMMWATRFWWMLRSLGIDALVLDGGFDKWAVEKRAIERGRTKGYPAATFKASPRAGLFVDKSAVLARLNDPSAVMVNALGPQLYRGSGPSIYGRPGRIPGSVNVPFPTLVNAADKTLISGADAEAKFLAQGVTPEKDVIGYCGGGISATIDLLMLAQLGYEKLSLYDGSMGEWAKDPALPIETG